MKRRFVSTAILMLLLIGVLCLAACSGNSYKVEFYNGKDLVATVLVDKGGSLDDIPDVPERAGYVGEWNVPDSAFDEINDNMKVFAVYTKSQYTITFYVDGKVFLTRTVNRRSRLGNVPAVPEKAGYVGEWSVTDFDLIDRDIEVHAVYTVADTYMTFVSDAAPIVVPIVNGTVTYIPEVPAVPGKSYAGKWVTTANGTQEAKYTDLTGSTTVYAHYYVVVSLVDGDVESVSAEIDESIDVPPYGRKVGFDFLGWYADAEYTEKVDFPASFSENTTLYARWLSTAGDEGFTFENGVVTGYTGDKSDPVVPYKYTESGQEVFVTKIAKQAFEGYDDLVEITLPASVVEIEEAAFHNARSLKEIKYPDGCYLRSVGASAFEDCVSLTTVRLSRFTTTIGARAFYGCREVETYEGLEKSAIVDVPSEAFYGNEKATKFELPSTLKTIGTYAFSGATEATFLFGTGITSIGSYAFENCYRLHDLYAPELTYVGERAFTGCRNVIELTVTSDKRLASLFTEENTDSENPAEEDSGYFYAYTIDGRIGWLPNSLKKVTVTPNQTATLVAYAFAGAKEVKNVVLTSRNKQNGDKVVTESIKVIEEYAFYMDDPDRIDSTVFSITIPEGSSSLTDIGRRAFYGRKDLTVIAFPKSLDSIGEEAFGGNVNLESVSIEGSNSLSDVGAHAFDDTIWFTTQEGVVRLGRVALGISQLSNKYELTPEDFEEVRGKDNNLLSEAVRYIAPEAFDGNRRLTKIALSDGVLEVGDRAFANSYLNELVLNAGCAVGEDILFGTATLSYLTVGVGQFVGTLFGKTTYDGSVAYVREEEDPNSESVPPATIDVTYYLPEGLVRLTILASTGNTVVQEGAYCGFSNIKEIILGEGITAVYDGALNNNPSLLSVTFPTTLVSVGDLPSDTPTNAPDEGEGDVEPTPIEPVADVVFGDKVGVFYGCGSLSSVVIPERSNLSIIYGKAFYGTSISVIRMPASLTYVGAYAFYDVDLTDLSFADGADLSIGDYAFAREHGSDSFVGFSLALPTGLASVGACAFRGRAGIIAVNLNDGLAEVGDGAFYGCSIRNLTIPGTVRFVGTGEKVGAFGGNPINDITLYYHYDKLDLFGGTPLQLNVANVYSETVGEEQFRDMVNLQNVVMSGVKYIEENAFAGCEKLTALTIPKTVESIGDRAFADCTKLMAVVFENGSVLAQLGEYVFENDDDLMEVDLPETISSRVFVGVFSGCTALRRANIPSSVTEVGRNAFFQCESLTSIAIPEGVAAIGDNAFDGCAVLEFENVKFDLLETIGERAFAGCRLLHAVKAENVSSIGADAFYGCVDLKEITIIGQAVSDILDTTGAIVSVNVSERATTIAENVFDCCTLLTSVTVFAGGDKINEVLGGLVGQERNGAKIFVRSEAYAYVSEANRTALTGALFPNPTELNATYLYDEQTHTAKLTAVDGFDGAILYLPSTVQKNDVQYEVTAIGERVFKQNLSIEEVIVPFVIEEIGNYAFEDCTNLRTLRFEVGSRLERIGEKAFYRTTALTYIDLPDSLVEIGERAFAYSGLTTIDNTVYSKLAIVGDYAFYQTDSLYIGDYTDDEEGGLIFKGTIARIGKYAFAYSGVTKVTIGERASEDLFIDEYAFAECYGLSEENIAYIEENYDTNALAFARHS